MALSLKPRVGVLRGGPSKEHPISLKTGGAVLKNMSDRYLPVDIFIDRAGTWHIGGVETVPQKATRQVDVIFNALHGRYGEDGLLQYMLDAFRVPYTGSGRLASALSMHKGHSKKLLSRHGIKSPYHKVVRREDATTDYLHAIFRAMPHPAVVKPAALGSSIGVSLVRDFFELQDALDQAFAESPTVLVEEYIAGREATCGVIENFRGEEIYVLLPVESVLHADSDFLDHKAKYAGKSERLHPGRFSSMEKEAIQKATLAAHRALDLRHYSRSDFIVSPTRGVYFLETNSLPGLSPDSPYAESLSAIGASLSEFLDHVLGLALQGK